MSVTTTADEKLIEAREHIEAARKALLVVLHPDTWGHKDFKSDYLDKLCVNLGILIKLRNEI